MSKEKWTHARGICGIRNGGHTPVIFVGWLSANPNHDQTIRVGPPLSLS
jgi:hypothetical protein